MIKHKGTTLYPPAMTDLLNSFEEIHTYQIIVSTSEIGTDEVLIRISCKKHKSSFLEEVKNRFRTKLRNPQNKVL